jgi:hypothetical protein
MQLEIASRNASCHQKLVDEVVRRKALVKGIAAAAAPAPGLAQNGIGDAADV